mmetsp:Transcript_17542/g.68043  ORF Transcript_17542/g.68043 Transcript_17542/m.68043 type:complete len:259 (-) Transcript_17542:1751-2527(-)
MEQLPSFVVPSKPLPRPPGGLRNSTPARVISNAYTPPGSFPTAQAEPQAEPQAVCEPFAQHPHHQQQQQEVAPSTPVPYSGSPVPVRLADAGGRHSFSGPSLVRSSDGDGGPASTPDVRSWQHQAVAKLSGKSEAELAEEQRAEQEAAFLLAKGIFLAGYAIKRGGGSTKFGRKSWKKRYFVLDTHGLSYYTMEGGEKKGGCAAGELKGAQLSAAEVPEKSAFPFEINTSGRTLIAYVASPAVRQKWIEKINDYVSSR